MGSGRPFNISRSGNAKQESSPKKLNQKATSEHSLEVFDEAASRDESNEPTKVVTSAPAEQTDQSKHDNAKRDRLQKKKPSWAIYVFISTTIIFAALSGFLWWQLAPADSGSIASSDEFQAITTTNGQVYFGKVSVVSGDYVKIKNAYFLQNNDLDNVTNKEENPSKLIKLANRVYNPIGDIILSSQQILSFEELNPSGQVAQLLESSNQ